MCVPGACVNLFIALAPPTVGFSVIVTVCVTVLLAAVPALAAMGKYEFERVTVAGADPWVDAAAVKVFIGITVLVDEPANAVTTPAIYKV